ncbi:hypothetical protein S245_004622 [Arachis hypogaea]
MDGDSYMRHYYTTLLEQTQVHGAAGSYFMFCKGFAILSICSDCSIQQGDNCTVFCMVLLLVASDITMEQNEA